MEVTINKKVYQVEADNYDGDLVLLNSKRDVTIEGGYEILRHEAVKELGIYMPGHDGDELDYSEAGIDCYIEQHIEDFIRHQFEEGKITNH